MKIQFAVILTSLLWPLNLVAQNREITQAFDYATDTENPNVELVIEPFDSIGGARKLEQVTVSFVGDLSMAFTVENHDPQPYAANDWFVEAYHSVLIAFVETPNFQDGGPFYFLGGNSIQGVTGDLSAGTGGDPFNPGMPGDVSVSDSFSDSIESRLATDASWFDYFESVNPLVARVGSFTELLISPPVGANFINASAQDIEQSGTFSLTYEYSLNVGDVNNDQVVDASDIDDLYQNLGGDVGVFDLNTSGQVDESDVEFLVEDLLGIKFGDSNLDGVFNSSDFVLVFQTGEYEDAAADNSTWVDGDWNGDREFDSSDLVFVFQKGDFANAATSSIVSVPEPTMNALLVVFGLAGFAFLRRNFDRFNSGTMTVALSPFVRQE